MRKEALLLFRDRALRRRILRANTVREFDEKIVAPLNGFAGADDYHARCSAAPVLGAIRTPTLLIHGLDDHLKEETGLPVSVAEDPLSCVALGTGRAMEDPVYRGVLMTA